MTIEIYDERAVDARAVHLTNRVGTKALFAGVGFSHPSGVTRVEDYNGFTHFKAQYGGDTYIYRVEAVDTINGHVFDITYSLDGVKDYFSKNNWSDLNSVIVTRSTNINDWSKLLPDDKGLSNGELETTASVLGSINRDIVEIVLVMKDPTATIGAPAKAYRMTVGDFGDLCKFLSYNDESDDAKTGSALYNMIDKAFISPFAVPHGSGQNLSFYHNGVQKTVGVTVYPVDTKQEATHGGGILSANYPVIHSYTDLQYTKWSLYIPYIGTVEVPASLLTESDGVGGYVLNLGYTYFMNTLDGTLSFKWNKIANAPRSANVVMPRLPIPTGAENLQASVNNDSYTAGQIMNGVTIAAGIAGTIASGGTLLGAAGAMTAIGGATGFARNKIDNDLKARTIESAGTSYSGSSGGWDGYIDNNIRLLKVKAKTDIQGYLLLGHPCNKLTAQVTAGAFKYWLDTTSMLVKGTELYKNIVRAEIGKDYIYYN